jgi:septal ring-binding cell division protein DamX
MTDISQSPGDRLRFEILLKSLTEGTMNLAVLSQHDMVLDFYGNLFGERLRAKGETDVEFCFTTNSETLVQKFNEILSDLTLNEALEKEKKSASRRYLIFRDSILMQDFELQLLARLVNGFPAGNITVILLINSAGNYRSKLEAFGKNLLQWEVETKAGEPKQALEDWVAETKETEPNDIAPASKLLNVQAKPSWRIPGFGNDKKEPVMEAMAPAVAATTSQMPEPTTAAVIPTLQDTPREPSLLSDDSAAHAIDQAAAPTVFEKPQRSFPWGWVVLALLLSVGAFGYMHRDELTDEIEQFKKYLLRGTPAVAMTPEDVASAEAAAKAAAEAASAAAQAQSEAQAASEPQADASAATSSASAAAESVASPAASAPVTTSVASAVPTTASAVAAPEPTPKETKANRSKKSEDQSDEAWVKQLTDSSYVLQLSAADTEEDILKFKSSHPIYANARVMSAPKKDSKKRYFILVAGPFENKTDADTYVKSHPLLSKGWLRNAKSMRNQFLRTQP